MASRWRISHLLLLAVLGILLVYSSNLGTDIPPRSSEPPVASASASLVSKFVASEQLTTVRTWVYQLQGLDGGPLDLRPLIDYPADLAVIDHSRDGSEAGAFSPDEIADLQRSGKRVLGYMAIGAADSDRFYDQQPGDSHPFSHQRGRSLVAAENPDFPGTFYLRYWLSDWQAILLGEALPSWVQANRWPNSSYLERILEAGFDGVYLDDIDAYQQFNEEGNGTRPSAALEMLLLIQDISDQAKARHPEFLVFPQNGEAIFQDAWENLDENGDGQIDQSDRLIAVQNRTLFLDLNGNHRHDSDERFLGQLDTNQNAIITQQEVEQVYFGSIDGLGAEDFFFKGERAEDNPFISTLAASDPRIEDFKFTAANYLSYARWQIPIFNVEYLTPSNGVGLNQYQQTASSQFRLENPGVTTDSQAAAWGEIDLQRLSIRRFAAPDRELDRLPSLHHSALSNSQKS
ncbi:MAG: endo alpha-1,4 polygalactosaminidase [Phormidesmis sp.]